MDSAKEVSAMLREGVELCKACNGYGATFHRPARASMGPDPFETPCEPCKGTGRRLGSIYLRAITKDWRRYFLRF